MHDDSPKGTILVVDDSPLVLEMVRDSLGEGGYRVLTSRSWVELNLTLQEGRPDLILLDLKMPSIRGENLCRILKESHTYRDIPVVLFSSMEAAEIQSLAEASGADGWIQKRMGPAQILEDVSGEFRRLVGAGGGRGAGDLPGPAPEENG